MQRPTLNHLRRFTTLLAAWVMLSAVTFCHAQEPLKLNDKTVFTFASVAEGQKLITARDEFVKRLAPLEIQLRMQSKEPVPKEAYLEQLKNGVREWSDADKELIKRITETLRARMKGYRLPFPKEIHLIRVSAEVEGNAPHCRAASIILPDQFFMLAGRAPEIMTHELFHVLSSHNPKIRDQIYKVIHFERSQQEVKLPPSLQARRLTNPDAPSNEHVIQLMHDGEKTPFVPVTLTKSNEYRSGGLFANLDFRLMMLEKKGNGFVAKLENGQPQLLSPREVPDFMKQIGRNTGYVIHPEETAAENFRMLILKSPVQDAWVIEEMGKILKE